MSGGKWRTAAHLELASFHLSRAASGRGSKRLLVEMPPRHGKSLLVSVWTPVWFLALWPHKRVILCSYEAGIAADFGRQVRNLLDEHSDRLKVRLSKDSKAANRWNTEQGGGMMTAGVGGPITGKGADLLLIDDPVKNSEQANSVLDREKKDVWFRETARTRLEPGAAIAIIQTRWHADDLTGRRLAAMAEGREHWTELRLPAVAEADDPLGRDPGDPLWPERYDAAALEELRRDVGEYGWHALFQQRPRPIEGGIFREEWFGRRYAVTEDGMVHVAGYAAVPLSSIPKYCTVDLASKEKELTVEDAFSVICTFGVHPSGTLLLLDVVRRRMSSPDTLKTMLEVFRRWPGIFSFWIESVAYQIALVQWARQAGLPCRELEADRDKATRALGAAPSCEAGRVQLPVDAPWLGDFLFELLSAPTGTFWDQVDAFSYGVLVYDQHRLKSLPLWGRGENAPGLVRTRPAAEATKQPQPEPEDAPETPIDRAMRDLASGRSDWRKQPW